MASTDEAVDEEIEMRFTTLTLPHRPRQISDVTSFFIRLDNIAISKHNNIFPVLNL